MMQKNDNQVLLASKNSILQRYNTVKKSAAQLEAFRKNMVTMIQSIPSGVEDDTGDDWNAQLVDLQRELADKQRLTGEPLQRSNGPPRDEPRTSEHEQLRDVQGQFRSSTHESLRESTLRTSEQPRDLQQVQFRESIQRTSESFRETQNDPFRDTQKTNEPFRESNGSQARTFGSAPLLEAEQPPLLDTTQDDSLADHALTSGAIDFSLASLQPDQSLMLTLEALEPRRLGKSASFPHLVRTDSAKDMDPPILYRHIRDTLSSTEFDDFAKTVTEFNGGRLSASQTVQKINHLLGPGVLNDQMTRLILEAVREAKH